MFTWVQSPLLGKSGDEDCARMLILLLLGNLWIIVLVRSPPVLHLQMRLHHDVHCAVNRFIPGSLSSPPNQDELR